MTVETFETQSSKPVTGTLPVNRRRVSQGNPVGVFPVAVPCREQSNYVMSMRRRLLMVASSLRRCGKDKAATWSTSIRELAKEKAAYLHFPAVDRPTHRSLGLRTIGLVTKAK